MPTVSERLASRISAGQRFGMLVAVEFAGVLESRGKSRMRRYPQWRFECDCGEKTVASVRDVLTGNTASCGCLRFTASRTHGHSIDRQFSPEYSCWMAMRSRCYDESNVSYPHYGGRGIEVCERWRDSFEQFLADMGPRPTLGHTLDRQDNAKGYEPENVVWATYGEQKRNTSRTVWVTFQGREMCLKDACEAAGLGYAMVRQRLKLGWPPQRALSEPPQPGRWH